MRQLTFALSCVALIASTLRAQSSVNPDISFVGNVPFSLSDNPSLGEEWRALHFDNPGIEIVAAGPLNPFARADITLAWEGGEQGAVEEAYASFLRGLPLGMNLIVGKRRLEFGRLNPTHPHAYPFQSTPLVHQAFFGEEGLNDMTICAAVLPATGSLLTELMIGAIAGNALIDENIAAQAEIDGLDASKKRPGIFARTTTSGSVSEFGELAVGASLVNSVYDPVTGDRSTVIGCDLKYKHRPNRQRSFTIEAEALRSSHALSGGSSIHSVGGYGYFDYRWRQKYNAGAIAEYAATAAVPQEITRRAALFCGFSPVEETSVVRLLADWTKSENERGCWSLRGQLIFSLGPHQPHTF